MSKIPPGASPNPGQLLATKLTLLTPRSKIVRRSRLTMALRDGMQKRLTLITAPAGYGKTTVVGEWISSISASSWPVASISLDEYDNHLLRFWSYMVAALQIIHPPLQFDIRELWHSSHDREDCTLLNPLINEISEIPHHFSLILDDYHEISEPSIHRTLSYLIDHLPPNCHLTLISRVIPPLSISRLRSRDQMAELTAADLCFTLDEAHTFLSSVMSLEIAWDEVVKLKELTEGWIAGLKLSALSLQGQRDAKNLIASLTHGYRHVLDYLTDEVLNRQEEAVKEFLLQTSILTELSAPLCNAILGRKDSQKMLDQLEQAGLFIIPLDDHHRWYRYHGLFADLLQIRLNQFEPEAIPDLNKAAYRWLNENGYPEKSIMHALAAGETELAADTVEQCALQSIIRTDLTTVFEWFNRLPKAIIHVRPRLAVYSALANLILGKADDLEDLLQRVESDLKHDKDLQIPQEEKACLRRYIDAIRASAACTRGDFSGGIPRAQQVLKNLLPEDYFFLGLVEHYLAYAYQAAGKLAQGAAAQEMACQNALRHQFHKEFVLSKSEKARFHRLQGRLHEAAEAYQLACDYACQHGISLNVQLIPLAGLADIQREWDNIPEADALLVEPAQFILASRRDPLDWFYMIEAQIAVAKNRMLHGEFDQAGVLLQNARQLAQIYQSIPDMIDEVSDATMQLLLARRDLAAAAAWAARLEREAQNQPEGIHVIQGITLARVELAAGRPDQAAGRLAALLAELEGSEQGEHLFEVLLLLSLARWQAGSRVQAAEVLDRALALAEPEGRIRAFLDCGEPMKTLLSYRLGIFEQQAGASGQKPGYDLVLRLIEQYKPRAAKPVAVEKPAAAPVMLPQLVEPLSERELEVLNLLAEGCSSGEVAQSLVISINTAKAHIKSIYQKMNVHNRKEAVELAYALHLFLAEAA